MVLSMSPMFSCVFFPSLTYLIGIDAFINEIDGNPFASNDKRRKRGDNDCIQAFLGIHIEN